MSDDLSHISTKDLLNEAYKRGAILRLQAKKAYSSVYFQNDDFLSYVNKDLRTNSLLSGVDMIVEEGILHISKQQDRLRDEVVYNTDIFICKHPLTLKDEGLV